MKNRFFLMVMASTLLLIISCNNAVNVDQLLKDDNTRKKVFTKITTDHEMMTDFMDIMIKDNHAMMMMKDNQGMKEMMMGEGGIMGMMKNKPELVDKMMGNMMKDGKMMGQMMEMMKDKGMMSEECANSCMKMMSGEGMDMDNKDDNHEFHNH